jgi:GNAT superfamily N-acetyltransferase
MGHLTSDDHAACHRADLPGFTLNAGQRVLIRPVDRCDRERLSDLFARMSSESRQRRFFSPKRELSSRELTYFTDIDHREHEALAAVDLRDGSFLGVARYVQFGDPPATADVSVEVADEHQRTGVGTVLMEHLIARGRANHIECLLAMTRWENAPARALARSAGFRARSSRRGEIVLELPLAPRGSELQAS